MRTFLPRVRLRNEVPVQLQPRTTEVDKLTHVSINIADEIVGIKLAYRMAQQSIGNPVYVKLNRKEGERSEG